MFDVKGACKSCGAPVIIVDVNNHPFINDKEKRKRACTPWHYCANSGCHNNDGDFQRDLEWIDYDSERK